MLKIVTYPNEILDKLASKVQFPLDEQTKTLIAEMWDTVKDTGVGLAAPQVGVSKQICIIHLSEEIKSKNVKATDFVMINPQITFYSEVENLMIEGCLSFPGQYYEIWRPANIIVEYWDEKGHKRTLKGKEWLSRVVQHEVDHLRGNLFINKGGKKIVEKDLLGKQIAE